MSRQRALPPILAPGFIGRKAVWIAHLASVRNVAQSDFGEILARTEECACSEGVALVRGPH
jgi:hypothetical protein